MDLRTRTSLFCGALALAIAASILLRGRARSDRLYFAAFAADIGLWYLAQWLYHFVRADVWAVFTAVLAVLLPQLALGLFEAIVPDREGMSTLRRVGGIIAIPMLVLVLSPLHEHGAIRTAVFLYVFGLVGAGFVSLLRRGERSGSRAIQRRVRFLVMIGGLATAFSLADFLWFIGAPLPPVGAVLSIVFLFVLAESMTRERLLDVYEMLGRLVVSTALAFTLAGIFYLFVVLLGGFNTMYLNAALAAIVILVLFEPLRDKVEAYIHRGFFRERVDLERAVTRARAELSHVLQIEELSQIVVTLLEASRRVTGVALYVRNPTGSDFELAASFGSNLPDRIDGVTTRPLLDHLASSSSVVMEEVARKVQELKRAGQALEADAEARLVAAAGQLGALAGGVLVGVRTEDEDLVAVLGVVDDRVRDAFSPEEVSLLESLAVQIGVVVENSRLYRRMRERDRLAELGQMAAGLAHEVKNPLGAIKGSAQLLAEGGGDEANDEFLDIILEEVDRLDRVVGSVLDYARPAKGNPSSIDVNSVVAGTVRLLASARDVRAHCSIDPTDGIPFVRADAEQLRQVIINLVHNAAQAGAEQVEVLTRTRRERRASSALSAPTEWVEIVVRDDGPGIPPETLEQLFVPFFTTKDKGTGLGLSISQRMIQEMGGRIEVASQPGAGATFSVLLPVPDGPLAQRSSLIDVTEHDGDEADQLPVGSTSPDPAQ